MMGVMSAGERRFGRAAAWDYPPAGGVWRCRTEPGPRLQQWRM